MKPTSLQKWRLSKTQDVSPSPWFPLEKRRYTKSDGTIVDNFYVTTLADSVHIVPITTSGKVILIRMYKQGMDEIMIQFPAGRVDPHKHASHLDSALAELEEETGIRATPDQLTFLKSLGIMTTKATEKAHVYLATNCQVNTAQKLDEHEDIEVLELEPSQVSQLIYSGQIWDAPAIAAWHLATHHAPQLLD